MSTELEKLLEQQQRGKYVPAAKIRALMKENDEVSPEEQQKQDWEKLKKRINGIVNKVNKENLKTMVVEIFKVNILRGKGLFCNSLMASQQLSSSHTGVYASLVCVLNSKIPEIGNLLIRRLVSRYKRYYRKEEEALCTSTVLFIANLVLFHVCSIDLIIQIVNELMEKPTNFSVKLVVDVFENIGPFIYDENPSWFDSVKDTLRSVMNENIVNDRIQFSIENLFNVLKEKIDLYDGIESDLDLVDEDDCVVHQINLKDKNSTDSQFDVFHFDENYKESNEKYRALKTEILGSDDEDGEDDQTSGLDTNETGNNEDHNSDFSSDNENIDESDDEDIDNSNNLMEKGKLTVQIKDLTEQELTNFQKNVYLTIMSSMSPEEVTHKLLRLPAIDPERKEYMLVDMVVKCCAQEKVYSKYYGLIGEILIVLGPRWSDAFETLFKENYQNCHKYETVLIRNIGAFWGHMLASDKLGWECLQAVELTEESTTSSGRIFLKFVFQKILEEIGINHFLERVDEPYIQEYLVGIFPKTNAEHLRFSINYFTAIGLGKLTDNMRKALEALPPDVETIAGDSSDESASSRGRSVSRSRSRSYSRSRSGSYSSSERNGNSKTNKRGRVETRSRSPRRRDESYSRSRSGSPRRSDKPAIPSGPRSYSGYRGGYRGAGRGGYRNQGGDRGRGGYNRNSSEYRRTDNYYRGGRFEDNAYSYRERGGYRGRYRGNERERGSDRSAR